MNNCGCNVSSGISSYESLTGPIKLTKSKELIKKIVDEKEENE